MYVNVAFAAPALIGALLLLAKPVISKKPKLDIPGIVVVSAALFAVVYGFAHVESTSWTDPVALGSMIVGAVLLAVFVWLESRVAHPLLPLRLVLDRTRGGSFAAVFVLGMGMFSIFLFLTYYFAASLGYSPIKTGLAFLPMVAGVVASSTTMPSLVLPRVGPKIVVSAGFLVAAAGMALLTRLELDSTYAAHIMPGLILLGLGIGAVMSTAIQGATSGIHHEDAGVASALINTGQQIGGSISTALLTTIASSAATDYLTSHKPSAQAERAGRGRGLHGHPGVGLRVLRGRCGDRRVPHPESGSGAVRGRARDGPLSLDPPHRCPATCDDCCSQDTNQHRKAGHLQGSTATVSPRESTTGPSPRWTSPPVTRAPRELLSTAKSMVQPDPAGGTRMKRRTRRVPDEGVRNAVRPSDRRPLHPAVHPPGRRRAPRPAGADHRRGVHDRLLQTLVPDRRVTPTAV